MFWALIAVASFSFVIGAMLWGARRSTPNDGLALALAADLGGSPPALVGRGRTQEWRVEFEREGRYELFVGAHGARLRRLLDRPLDHAAHLSVERLTGRAQEDYGIGCRTLAPDEHGTFSVVSLAQPGQSGLRGWEERLPVHLADSMRRLRVRWIGVDLHWLETGRVGADTVWVEEAADMLRTLDQGL